MILLLIKAYLIIRLGAVMCMGVTAGAYILTLFAVCIHMKVIIRDFNTHGAYRLAFVLQMKYRERVLGLILVSPLCRIPSWSEWFYNKVPFKPSAYCSLRMSASSWT